MNSSSNRFSLIAGLMVAAVLAAGCQHPRQEGSGPASAPSERLARPVPTKESQAAMTPDQVLAQLRAGNARFVSGQMLARNFPAEVRAASPGQYPYAVVLSCLDSRQPIELVLDQGIGDIFSARVAGNVLDDDILGSMEFACKVTGAKLIAVIGHSNCGAIKGAVDDVELGHLTKVLARIKPAIDHVPTAVQPRNSTNAAFVDQVGEANVRLVMQQIRERSPILREMLDRGEIGLAGGMYDLSTGKVRFFSD